MNTLLPELFQPLAVGPMRIANRIMMSGMSAGTNVDENGDVSPETIAYFVERARHSPGMMAMGAAAVVPPPPDAVVGRSGSAGIRLYSDAIVPSLRRLVDAVHQWDAKFGVQLFNAGGTERGRNPLISPSGISSNVRDAREPGRRRSGLANRALALDEIPTIVEYYACAAARCRDAGFDFVEIHAGHGYLISNFLTPLFNRRDDRYGGSFENRTRFLLEIVAAVKARVGAHLAVGVKFNGDDFIGEEGWTLADSRRLAPLLEAAGADYMTLTAGLVGSPRLTIPPLYEPQGCYVDLAEAVKPLVRIPVASVGRIKDPLMARDLVRRGSVDFVVLGRAFIADPEFVGKARAGALSDIRPCLAECRGCADEHIQRGGHTSCVVNPRMCRELDLIEVEGRHRDRARKVLVVGGGLAGMEVARHAAFNGHQVTLCERDDTLGGQLRWAATMPGRGELGDILPWYQGQLAKYRVTVRTGATVDRAMLEAIRPDVVVVATGSVPEVPQQMTDAVMKASRVRIRMLDDLMREGVPPAQGALVIGGDQNGVVVADWLAREGCDVWVAESEDHFARKLAGHDRWYLLNRLTARKVQRIKRVGGLRIVGDQVESVQLIVDGMPMDLPAVDLIVFASERRSDRGLAEIARGLGIETLVAGDAHDATSEHAGTIFANIAHAYDVARRI